MVSPNIPHSHFSPIPLSTHSNHSPKSSLLMTITLEPVVRRSTISGKEAIAIAQAVPQPPPTTTRPDQPLASTPAKATNLLQNFIEAYKEVDSYRYVSRVLVTPLARAENFYSEMEVRSLSTDTTFPSQPSLPLRGTMLPSLSMIPLAFENDFSKAGTLLSRRCLLARACMVLAPVTVAVVSARHSLP